MKNFSRLLTVSCALAMALVANRGTAQDLTLLSQTALSDGAEILSFTSDENTVASNVTGVDPTIGIQLYTLNADGTLTPRNFISVSTLFGGMISSVSSVALDPLGRGFGFATVIPNDNGGTPGALVLFNYRTGEEAVIDTFTTGFHPDNVSFSKDGSKVFIADEGEFTTGGATDAPGSVTIVDLCNIGSLEDLTTLRDGDVFTIDFSAPNLASGVNLDSLRYNDNSVDALANKHLHVEPEYITDGGDKIYVTLQENNGIAELSLMGPDAYKYTAIYPLGTIEQTIDASDRDGPGDTELALIDDVVKGMPMPDTITSFVSGGILYLVTANEGDFRGDDNDRMRIKSYTGTEGAATGLDTSDAGFGRLRVIDDVSDPDGNGILNDPVMPGTRSFSIWNSETGALVADTGSFEPLLLTLFPTFHNINGEDGTGTLDDRSDDKGPEPEAITYGEINGHSYIFVGMERQGALLMFNVDDPANPTFVAAINNVGDGLVAPESIVFVSASDSPSGSPFLLVGYEEEGGDIGIYAVEGEAGPKPILRTRVPKTVGPGKPFVRVKGRTSPDVERILVNGDTVKRVGRFNQKVRFPRKQKRLRVRIVAISSLDGPPAVKRHVVRRKGR